jgi:hypothetical protein
LRHEHKEICARASAKKTKVLDAKEQRLQGSEAASDARNPSKDVPKRESNHKREHEKLVEALRAERKFTDYEEAREEGRAIGPPPALPKYEIEDDDRLQCPRCGRKFAAEAPPATSESAREWAVEEAAGAPLNITFPFVWTSVGTAGWRRR